MPCYEYVCNACGETFEADQRMSDPPLTGCKCCGEEGTVSRLIGLGGGVIFKGSGFYGTDYKKSDAPKSEGASRDSATTKESAPATAESKSDSKTETKAAVAAESKPAHSCGPGCKH